MKNVLFDVDVILDIHSLKRAALFPESVKLYELAKESEGICMFISSSSLDNIAFLKTRQLETDFPGLTRKQQSLCVGKFITDLLKVFKLAKTPSYLTLDETNIEKSLVIGSAIAAGAQVVTRDQRVIDKHPDIATSAQRFISEYESNLENKPTSIEFIDLKKQYRYLQPRIEKQLDEVLNNASFIMGDKVRQLESKLAERIGVKHAITCANGTDALTLCMMVLDFKQGDAVFCPTFTFFATAEAIAFAGATPVFVDSDPATFNICPEDLERRIQQVIADGKLKPKAIISVDLFGLPANYPKLERLAAKYNLKLIEDAAQGFGGEIDGRKAGSFGDLATTSFFPAKPLGCYGDGGAVFTNNDEYASLLRSYRVHGKGQDKYDNVRIGMNSRLDTIQAAILLEKLSEFSQEIVNRNKVADQYESSLNSQFSTPQVPEGYVSAWAQYTLLSDNRDEVMAECKRHGVPSIIYYGTCMHQQTAFSELGYREGDFVVAESLCKRVFSLPMHPYLTPQGVRKVLSSICKQ